MYSKRQRVETPEIAKKRANQLCYNSIERYAITIIHRNYVYT